MSDKYDNAYAAGVDKGRFLERKDLISAGYQDMSYYRRRSPQEIPAFNSLIIYKDKVVSTYRPAETDNVRFTVYRKGRRGFDDIDWWAYAYLPPEQKGKDKE